MGFRQPCASVVKGGGGVLEAAVVCWRVDDDLALWCSGYRAGKGEHVEVHLGAEALGHADGGDPAREGDKGVCVMLARETE